MPVISVVGARQYTHMSQKNYNKDRQIFWLTGIFVVIAIMVFAFAIKRMRMSTENSPNIVNSENQPKPPIAGKFNIIRVTDGDSLLLIGTDGIKLSIRLRGIDAPELGQPHGLEAKQALSSIVSSKSVSLDTLSKGKYGRYVANVRHGEVWVLCDNYLVR